MTMTHIRTYDLQEEEVARIELYIESDESLDPDLPSSVFVARYYDEGGDVIYVRRFSTFPDYEDLINA